MKAKQLKGTGLLAVTWALIALVVLTAATFAWFSFAPYTNVTPMTGSISGGDGNLLISTNRDSGFDTTCELVLMNSGSVLQPLSTADLRSFFTAGAQDTAGITIRYAAADRLVNDQTLHGIVYLRAEGATDDIYFDRDNLYFGTDAQALAALRLGLRITVAGQTSTHIFRLDDMGDTTGAQARLTVPQRNTVVSAIDAGGQPAYLEDPAEPIPAFCAQRDGESVLPGASSLCTIPGNEIAEVEYWVYLEGCDENCFDEVQLRDLGLQLGFAGVPVG